MGTFLPDKTFYPSARLAMVAEQEHYAYVAILQDIESKKPNALAKIDVLPSSSTFGKIVDRLDLPHLDDELHHYGWNACSSALCPFSPHPHIKRRYLIVPGIRSSRLYFIDTKDPSGKLKIYKTIEPEEIMRVTGYSRLHTVHCGPSGVYISALAKDNGNGPGGIFLLDHETFRILGPWELDRGPQYLSYDFWWHLGSDTLISSEWGTPDMFENGLVPEKLLKGEYGHQLHFWSLSKRKHQQVIDLGADQQMVLEVRPAHDPAKNYGFVSVVVSIKDLSAAVWTWYQENDQWKIKKTIEIPAVPVDDANTLPPMLKDFKAVPPFITDIVLSLDDRYLYVSCWGTGELYQYDVSDPFEPKLTGKITIGGIVNRTPHPKEPNKPLNGGPQMVECSRDGKRIYFTNSLYSTIDDQLYPDKIKGWMVMADVHPEGGLALNSDFFVDFSTERPHQIRLEGGDASSDSYWFS